MKINKLSLLKGCQVHRALSDPTRIRILNLILHKGEIGQYEIVSITGETQTKISRHCKNLVNSSILNTNQESKNVFYRINPQILNLIKENLHKFKDEKLNNDLNKCQKPITSTT